MRFNKDIIIGLEIHVELDTKTKLFCGCPTHAQEPNTATCEVCLGLPGSKPVLNEKALQYALKLCLATQCKISNQLIFSRKSYFYPDMSKNYQITQYELPLGKEGQITLSDGKQVKITRIHMEEDPAALVHPAGMNNSSYVMVDYNRSGNPLVEIVTEPELDGPAQARDFMKQLINILSYLDIFDSNRGIIKADANVSIKDSGYIRSEIKNVTGFREIERALEYEVSRHRQAVKDGVQLVQETRAWDAAAGITRPMRTKETEEDYGYILDPDLVRIEITQEMVSKVQETLPELHYEKAKRFAKQYKIAQLDAQVLATELHLAELFEKVAKTVDPILAARWLRRELMRVLNYNKKDLREVALDESHIIDLLTMVEERKITENVAKKLLERLVEKPFDVKKMIDKEDLGAVADQSELRKICREAISESGKASEEYKSGNEKALHFIIGKVMQKTKGKADPYIVKEVILKELESQ